MSHLDRITLSSGHPASFRDTGVTVATVLTLMGAGESVERTRALHPALEAEDVQAALDYVVSVMCGPAGSRAAGLLGISRRSFVGVLKRHTISLPRPVVRAHSDMKRAGKPRVRADRASTPRLNA
jgi:uncharacterized protein (DUF433 family)